MGIGQRALKVSNEGIADGRVCAQLHGCAGDEGACSHDDRILIAGHIPGLGHGLCIHGRAELDGLDEADILEVIDHHKLGAMATNSPINFRIMAVGCTNTIIHSIYEQNNFPIPKDIAGIMLAGIISDTLMLKSPTTTQFDKQAVLRLSKIAGVDFEKFGIEMFKAGSSIKGKSLEEILFTDFKVFKVGNIEAGIGQIFTTDYESLKIDIEKFRELLNKTSMNNDYLVVCLFITDIINNGSYIIYNDRAKHILEDSFDLESLNQGAYMQDIVSRKKQILPPIIEVLQKK